MRIILVFLGLCFSFSAFGANKTGVCSTIIPAKASNKTYRAPELTAVVLRELIGARISYIGKYAYKDPSDDRRIKGEGLVTSVAIWANDSIPTFSMRILMDSGEYRHTQIAYEDATFRLKVREASELPRLLAAATQDGLLTRFPDFHSMPSGDVEFLRDANHQNLRVFYIAGDGTESAPFKVDAAISSMTKVPTDVEIAMAWINSTPLGYEFLTPDGPLKIDFQYLLAVAY